jgi:hypothetical protein
VANLRLVLDVEVQAGNHTAALYSRPGLWALIERLGLGARPAFIRGDCAWGNEGTMVEAEGHGMDYLFKLKQSPKVRRLIEQSFAREDWTDAGQGWEGVEDELRLSGWTRARRVIVLRRPVRSELALQNKGGSSQMELGPVNTKSLTFKARAIISHA